MESFGPQICINMPHKKKKKQSLKISTYKVGTGKPGITIGFKNSTSRGDTQPHLDTHVFKAIYRGIPSGKLT